MLFPSYAALSFAIVLGVAGQLLFKSGAERAADSWGQLLNPLTLGEFAVYGLSAVLYIISLRRLPLSVAFPSVSLSYIAVAAASHFIWNEPFGWTRLIAMVLIVLGVGLLNYGV